MNTTTTTPTPAPTSTPNRNELRRRIRSVLWAVALLGFLASLVSAAQRWRVEARNRRVEITLDYQEVRALSVSEGRPLPDVLKRFRAAGVTSVALQEETVAALEDTKQVEFAPTESPDAARVRFASPEARRRVERVLAAKMPQIRRAAEGGGGGASPVALAVALPQSTLRGLGIGLDPRIVAEIQGAGLAAVGRVNNYNGVRPPGIRFALEELKRQGVNTVIFSGDEALGFKGYLTKDPERPGDASTAQTLRDLGMNLGAVEFSKQKGDALLVKALADRVVRVHTILGAEMLTASIPSNVQRFQLAARERNIRLLYVRLFLDEKDPLEKNAEYVEKIVRGMERGALEPGPAHPYDPLTTSLPLRALIGLGIAAGWVLLVDSVTRVFAGGAGAGARLVAFGGGLVLAALPCAPVLLGPKLAAFAAALIFPTLALLHFDLIDRMRARPGLLPAIGEFLRACCVTGLGIAAVVGLLSDRLFLVKADGFIGVKVSNLLPVVLVGLAYALPLRATQIWDFRRALRETGERLVRLSSQPLLFWHVALALVTLVALALLVLRTGNDPGVGVSSLELRVRAILDQVLYVRPRFKEFLIGHPALILGLLAAGRGRRDLAVPLLAVGAIGQASLLGVFCHLHTPLLVCLVRAVLGIVIAILIAAGVYLVVEWWGRRAAAAASSAPKAAAP